MAVGNEFLELGQSHRDMGNPNASASTNLVCVLREVAASTLSIVTVCRASLDCLGSGLLRLDQHPGKSNVPKFRQRFKASRMHVRN